MDVLVVFSWWIRHPTAFPEIEIQLPLSEELGNSPLHYALWLIFSVWVINYPFLWKHHRPVLAYFYLNNIQWSDTHILFDLESNMC